MLELVRAGLKAIGKEPIFIYENKQELLKSLEEWKHRLYLDSWTIAVGYHGEEDFPGECGHVEFLMEKQTAKITLLDPWVNDRITKHYQEETLVHELLHLKIGFIKPDDTLEEIYYDLMQHQLIDELSHALVNAKYGLDKSWWYNHKDCR